MSQVINTNVLSLTAQRNLQTSQSELATSLQRLSSGLRINSAKDDAAGLAISERFTTQIRGLNQAIRNSNDGISLSQTGEAALATVTDNLQRIRELAVQSVNATNSNADRNTLDQEVQQRLAEIDRIAGQTSFNGRNVLDGTFGSAEFQVGANVGQTISLNLSSSVRTEDVGSIAQVNTDASVLNSSLGTAASSSLAFDAAAVSGASGDSAASLTISIGDDVSFNVSGTLATTTVGSTTTFSAASFASALNDNRDAIEAAGFTIVTAATGAEFTGEIQAGSLGTYTFARADGTAFTVTETVADGDGASTAFDDGTGLFGTTGSSATADATTAISLSAGEVSIKIGDADAVELTGSFATNQELVDGLNRALGGNATALLQDNGVIEITSGETLEITTTGTSNGADLFTGGTADTVTVAASGSLEAINVRSVDASNDALQRIDAALTEISNLRSTFGAVQNRFESTIENLTTTSENLQASRSRILDADFAQETANLTRVQILQQAGISVLSQANVQPQNVLALLQ